MQLLLLMGARAAIELAAEVAVMAEHLEPCRIAVTTQPGVEPTPAGLLAMLAATAVDVVQRQKQERSFGTAGAPRNLTAICLKRP